jgi:hypothetical protein
VQPVVFNGYGPWMTAGIVNKNPLKVPEAGREIG